MHRAQYGRRVMRQSRYSLCCGSARVGEPVAPECCAAHRVADLTRRAAALIPPLDRPILANDRRLRQEWDDLVWTAAMGLRSSADGDQDVIGAALDLIESEERPLAHQLLKLAAEIC